MHNPMPLAVADAQLHQALADFTAAYDNAMSQERVVSQLAVATILQSLRYVEKNGLTDQGRKRLGLAIDACRSVLGAT